MGALISVYTRMSTNKFTGLRVRSSVSDLRHWTQLTSLSCFRYSHTTYFALFLVFPFCSRRAHLLLVVLPAHIVMVTSTVEGMRWPLLYLFSPTRLRVLEFDFPSRPTSRYFWFFHFAVAEPICFLLYHRPISSLLTLRLKGCSGRCIISSHPCV